MPQKMNMRIRSSGVIPYCLPLKAAWRSAAGDFSVRSGWLLRLETEDGLSGWGECAPLTSRDGGLETRFRELAGMDWAGAKDWFSQAGLPSAAACAVDTALSDLAAQAGGVPLAHLLNPRAESGVRCNTTLGALDEEAVRRAGAAIADGFEVLKFKVGMAGVNSDLTLLRQVAENLPPGVMLRLDANRAWGFEDASRFLSGLVGLPVEMLEEPLRQPDLAGLAALQEMTRIPLALDESLPELGLENILAAAPVRRLVIKPMLLGGLRAGYDLAWRAREAGMTCVVTTTVDSVVGTLAALHLAAALANGLHHGLATSSWLMRDVGLAPDICGGILRVGRRPGLGYIPLSGVEP